MTLGGHVDRGLTLAALYDIGVLERLRLEVRIRLIADLTQSLACLHANPRLMAAHPHLVVTPSTIVIGLDGVARLDVRAAKKRESERDPLEADYVAPEVIGGDGAADLRADVYSLGVLTWEALAGKRIGAANAWSSPPSSLLSDASPSSDLPAALGGVREPLRRKAAARPGSGSKASHGRLRTPPPLTLPEGGEWAMSLAELALQALCVDPGERLPDCRPIIHELERIATHLATTQEIAEVVQGISTVETLCIPEPTLPDADAACQAETGGRLGFMDRQPCSELVMQSCAQRPAPLARRIVEPVPASAAVNPPQPVDAGPELSTIVKRLPLIGSVPSNRTWFAAALLSLAVLGLLAGYVASVLGVR